MAAALILPANVRMVVRSCLFACQNPFCLNSNSKLSPWSFGTPDALADHPLCEKRAGERTRWGVKWITEGSATSAPRASAVTTESLKGTARRLQLFLESQRLWWRPQRIADRRRCQSTRCTSRRTEVDVREREKIEVDKRATKINGERRIAPIPTLQIIAPTSPPILPPSPAPLPASITNSNRSVRATQNLPPKYETNLLVRQAVAGEVLLLI